MNYLTGRCLHRSGGCCCLGAAGAPLPLQKARVFRLSRVPCGFAVRRSVRDTVLLRLYADTWTVAYVRCWMLRGPVCSATCGPKSGPFVRSQLLKAMFQNPDRHRFNRFDRDPVHGNGSI